MLCKSPIIPPFNRSGGLPVPCGQCSPCRLNRRRVSTTRLMLEAGCHEHSSFVTLTYSDEYLPKDGTLVPSDLKKFTKKLQTYMARDNDIHIRYYAVGEYGDKSWRPHYHLIVFGLPPCLNEYRKKWLRKRKLPCDCDSCAFVHRIWGKGHIDVGNCTLHSAQYVAGYVTKKMTSTKDERLNGRYPEFSRWSNKPGLGLPALPYILEQFFNPFTGEILYEGDLPSVVRIGEKDMPLGRYLRNKLKDAIGADESTSWKEKMLSLQKDWADAGFQPVSFTEFLAEKAAAKINTLEIREFNHRLKRSL